MAHMSNTQPKLFPAWDLASKAYRALFENLGYAVRICWAWVLVMAAAVVAADLIAAGSGVDGFDDKSPNLVLVVPLWLLLFGALSSIAVAWHRWLLLGEKITEVVYLRLDMRVAVYYGYAMAVFLISLAPIALVWGISAIMQYGGTLIFAPADDGRTPVDILFSQQGLLGFPLLQIAAFIVLVILTARLGVVLPARAIEAPEGSLWESWKITSGNSWGLFVGTGICVLPYFLLMGLIRGSGFDFSASDGSLLHILDRVAIQALSMLLGLVEVGFLAQCFRYFYPGSKAVTTSD